MPKPVQTLPFKGFKKHAITVLSQQWDVVFFLVAY